MAARDHPPGGRADFDSVYAATWPEMVRIARLLTGSRTAGGEVAQDAFVGLLRHFDQVQNPAAYLRRSVANGARSAYRRRREHEPLDHAHDRAVESPDLDETWLVLDALTSRQRVVVVLRFYEDLPVNQIADALGRRLGTVKSCVVGSAAAPGWPRARRAAAGPGWWSAPQRCATWCAAGSPGRWS